MGNDPLELLRLDASLFQGVLRRAIHGVDCILEDFLARHLEELQPLIDHVLRDGDAATACRDGKDLRLRTVRAEVAGDEPPRPVALLQDDRTRTIAEEDAGVAVVPVDDGGKLFRADDQDGLVEPRGDELIRRDERVEEAGAGGRDIEGGSPCRPDLVLDVTGGGGEGSIRRAGGDDDQIDRLGIDAAQLHGLERRCCAHVGGEFVRFGQPSFADAGAAHDPVVRRLNHLFEVGVGKHARGQIGPGGDDGTRLRAFCHAGRSPRRLKDLLYWRRPRVQLESHSLWPWGRNCRAP